MLVQWTKITIMTLGGRVFPPGTPQFCWCLFSLHCHKAGREAEHPEPGPSECLASWKQNATSINGEIKHIKHISRGCFSAWHTWKGAFRHEEYIFLLCQQKPATHKFTVLFYLFMSTVVTSKVTPFSHNTINKRWENGQLPMLWPSLPAWENRKHT